MNEHNRFNLSIAVCLQFAGVDCIQPVSKIRDGTAAKRGSIFQGRGGSRGRLFDSTPRVLLFITLSVVKCKRALAEGLLIEATSIAPFVDAGVRGLLDVSARYLSNLLSSAVIEEITLMSAREACSV